MAITRQGTLEKIRYFAAARLSSYLLTLQNHTTMKDVAATSGVTYSSLIGLKNMTLKSPSLQKIVDVMVKVGMDFEIAYVCKGGKEEVRMTIEKVKYVEDAKVDAVVLRNMLAEKIKSTKHLLVLSKH